MTLTAVTDHVESGLSKLIEQFQGKPRLEAWITSYLLEVQALSDAAWEVIISRLLDDAVGVHLQTLGKIVGQPWRSELDARYRVLIRARIAVNKSRGRPDDILTVANLLFDVDFSMIEFYPGALVIVADEPLTAIPDLEHEMLELAAGSGVRVDVHFSANDPDDWFMFGTGPGWGVGEWIGAVSYHTVPSTVPAQS